MSSTSTDPRLSGLRAAPKKRLTLSWSDPRLRAILWQVVIVGAIAGGIWYLVSNTAANLEQRRIATGFAFMGRTAGIPIGEHLISYDPAINTYGRAFLVGVLNTLMVSAIGVFLVTLLGTFVGIASLSKNFLLSRLCRAYVEGMRDIPLLLHLLFWYALILTLPTAREAMMVVRGVFVSNSGVRVPLLIWDPAHGWAVLALAAGAAATWYARRRATAIQYATGVRPRVWPVAVAALVVLPLAVWFAMGAPFALEMPTKGRFRFEGGGSLSPEFIALMIGLVLYHSAYAGEIVRSGIQSVPSGQWEAGGALGLKRGTMMRQIVLPQALRVIIPPMTSTYLGVAKNSSLAVAIGYPDLVAIVNTMLNQTGQAIEGIALIMVVYLGISLSISLFMNWYNARMALVER
ncbi:MAG: ABC transporter permease subunit [Acetobacteraceae bacterium]|nr:ABC transporter permease subunit [Acetobacteraceae bacterium]